MRLFSRYTIAAFAASVLLASCGGGGGSSHASSPAVLPAAGSAAASGAQFTVSVARTQSQMANRQTAAISAGIASLIITASGSATASTTINVAANATGCTATATLITCTGTLNLVPGNYTFAVQEYAGANGTGSLLGTGSVNKTLVAGALTNVTLTLNGIVSSVQLALDTTSLPSSAAATVHLTVMALDPSGNIIIGQNGSYVDATGAPVTISVTTSGGSGITLSATQVTSPLNAVINVAYSGAAVSAGTQAVFHATATTATGPLSAQAVALTFLGAGTLAGSLYVVTSNFLSQLSADATSIVTRLVSPQFPRAIGYDTSKDLYIMSNSSVLEYPPNVGTSGAPKRVLSGPAVESALYSQGAYPVVDGNGGIYALNYQNQNNLYAVNAYSATASGNAAPDKTWTLADITNIGGNPTSIAADQSGNVYVASYYYDNGYQTQIDIFPSSMPSGPVTPVRTIVVPGVVYGIGCDAANNIYAYEGQSNQLYAIPAGTPSGPYSPVAFSDGTSNGFVQLAVEANGAVDAIFESPNIHIAHFPAGSSGVVTSSTLLPSANGFGYTSAIATMGTGLSVVDQNSNLGNILMYSSNVVATGGAVPADSGSFSGVPFGVGSPQNVAVAANGDVLVAGNGGPDVIDVYPAGTLALGTPARSILSGSVAQVGAAFEDTNGYIYAMQTGPGGASEESIARRAAAAIAKKRAPAATRVLPAASRAVRAPNARRRPAGFFISQTEIAVFAPGASGTALPQRIIETTLPYIAAGMVTSNGTAYVVGPGAVLVYQPGSSSPLPAISYPGANVARAIAVDGLGYIYITDGTTIYVIKPGDPTANPPTSPAVQGSFLITNPAQNNNSILVTNATNLYVSVDAGLESYPLSAVRNLGLNATAPPLNSGILPVYDPTISSPYIFTATFGP